MTIAVTGVTGVLGRFVAQNLTDAGIAQRLLARTPAKAPHLPNSTVEAFSYSDADANRMALVGVTHLFMVSASESESRLDQHRAFIDSAVAAGVQHIVYTSFFGAAPDATFTLARDHDVTEKYIAATGLDYTFLRDSLYLDFLPALAGQDGVIRGPARDGRVAAVAREDIGRVAAAVLLDPGAHAGATYDLTGGVALTFDEIADTITEVTGRKTTFHDETIEEAYASRAPWNAPAWQVDAWVSTYTAIAAGELARVSGDVEAITGRAPMTLEDYLRSMA